MASDLVLSRLVEALERLADATDKLVYIMEQTTGAMHKLVDIEVKCTEDIIKANERFAMVVAETLERKKSEEEEIVLRTPTDEFFDLVAKVDAIDGVLHRLYDLLEHKGHMIDVDFVEVASTFKHYGDLCYAISELARKLAIQEGEE